LEVGRVFDLLSAVPGADVGGNHVGTIQDADTGGRRDDDEGTSHVVVWNGIIVEVKARVGGLSDLHFDALVAGEGYIGEREQPRALLGEGVRNGARGVLMEWPLRGEAVAPLQSLSVEVAEVLERARGEEAIAGVPDRALDAAFLVASCDRDRPGLEVVMRGELKEGRVKMNRVADALEDSALEIVVEQDTRDPAEEGKGLDVAAEEARHRGAEEKAQEDLARPGQDHHEGGESSRRGANGEGAKARPIDLGLFTWQSPEAQKGFGGRRRA
jgi:hypothetical protein